MMRKMLSLLLSLIFFLSQISYAMPSYGMMNLSSGRKAADTSILLNGFRISSSGNIEFFYSSDGAGLKKNIQMDGNSFEFKKILENFFSAVAIPQKDWWVNLNIFIDPEYATGIGLGQTYLGKVLLESDLKMKELAMEKMAKDSSLMEMVQSRGGDISKVRFWIEPDRVKVIEDESGVYIREARLKVKAECLDREIAEYLNRKICSYLTKEVNQGKEFEGLRAAYRSLILAKEYKERFSGRIEKIDRTIDTYALPELSGERINIREYLCRFTALYAESLRDEDIAKVYSGGFSGVGINPSVVSGDVKKAVENNPSIEVRFDVSFEAGKGETNGKNENESKNRSIHKKVFGDESGSIEKELLVFKAVLSLGLGLVLAGILLYVGLSKAESQFYGILISLLGGISTLAAVLEILRLEQIQKKEEALFEREVQSKDDSLIKGNEKGMTNLELVETLAVLGSISAGLLFLTYVGSGITWIYVLDFLVGIMLVGTMMWTLKKYLVSKRKVMPIKVRLYGDISLLPILDNLTKLEREYLKFSKTPSELKSLQSSIEKMWGEFWNTFLDGVGIRDRAKKVAAMKYITHVVGQDYFDYSHRSEDDLAGIYGDRDFANNAIIVMTIDLLKEHFGRDGLMAGERKKLYEIMDQSIYSTLARKEREYIAYGKKLFSWLILTLPLLLIPKYSFAGTFSAIVDSTGNYILPILTGAAVLVGAGVLGKKIINRRKRNSNVGGDGDNEEVNSLIESFKDDVIEEIRQIAGQDKADKFIDEFATLWESKGNLQEKAILLAQLIKEANLVDVKAGKDKTFGERMGIILEKAKVGQITHSQELSDLLSKTVKNNPTTDIQRPEVINGHGGIDLNYIMIY